MISKYLKALIDSNNRIIIPDFGAFMIQESPEGKQITFNDFLKFNDGLLINQIIKTEKISKNQAADVIKEFITEIEKAFSKNQSYEISGLGFLNKDNHGNIKFELKPSTAGAEKAADASKAKTAATDVKPTIVLDETQAKESEATPKPKPAAETKPTTPIKEEQKPEVKAPESTKTEEKTPTPTPTPTPKVAASTAAAAAAATRSKPILSDKKPMTTNTQKTNSNSKNVIIIVAALVIILAGATWSFIKFDLGSIFGNKEVPVMETTEVPVPVMDTIVEDTVVPEPIVVEEAPAPAEQYVKKYYLIAGSFKVPSNATNFKEKLMDEGYESEIVIRNNGFHCVSYKTYYNWRDVHAGWKDMRTTDSQTWILVR